MIIVLECQLVLLCHARQRQRSFSDRQVSSSFLLCEPSLWIDCCLSHCIRPQSSTKEAAAIEENVALTMGFRVAFLFFIFMMVTWLPLPPSSRVVAKSPEDLSCFPACQGRSSFEISRWSDHSSTFHRSHSQQDGRMVEQASSTKDGKLDGACCHLYHHNNNSARQPSRVSVTPAILSTYALMRGPFEIRGDPVHWALFPHPDRRFGFNPIFFPYVQIPEPPGYPIE